MVRLGAIVIGLAIIAFVVAPTAIATVTGRPLSVDCGGREPTLCEQGWRNFAGDPNWFPVTWVIGEPHGSAELVVQDSHQRGQPFEYATDENLFVIMTDDDAWAEDALGQLP